MLETGDTGKAVSAESDGALYSAIIGSESYVLNVGKKFTAEIQSNNKIKINDGSALVNGRHVRIASGDSELITINNGSHGMNRKDIIVIRYQKEPTGIESVKFLVIQGEETSLEAKVPSYTKGNILTGSTVVDFPLYEVSLTGINITEVKKLFKVLGTNEDLSDKVAELNGNMNGIKYKRYTVTKNFAKGINDVIAIDIPWDKIVSIQGTLRYGANLHALPTSPVGGSGTYNEGMLAQLVITSSNMIQLWLTVAWTNTTLSVVVGYTD